MLTFGRMSICSVALLAGCASAAVPDDEREPRGSVAAPTTTASVEVAAPVESVVLGAPPEGPPRLVIENHSTADIRLYRGWIVDEEGDLGTMPLWPHPNDCPEYEPKERVLKLRDRLDLPAPTHAYDDRRCGAGAALPPGKYVVHIESGYGSELYAAAEVTLPLAAPVLLKMQPHDAAVTCDPKRARRAARLAIAAAKAQGVTDATLAGCDPKKAMCGRLPLPEEESAPSACTLTLHENLMRIRRPPTGDAPTEITSWLDRELVFAERPDVSRSSSAEIRLKDGRVVFEGITAHHMHEHGGDAARIGTMQVRVANTTKRVLKLSVAAVEWLSDHSCGAPQASGAPPKVEGFEPAEIAPGISTIDIRFTPRGAYQAHCDIFASKATLTVENRTVGVTSEHEVTRIEPLR